MITQAITKSIKLILIGIEPTFNVESYSTIEQKCLEISKELISKLN